MKLWLLFLIVAIISACSSIAIQHSWMPTSKLSSIPCRVVQHAIGETCVPNHPKQVITISPYSLLSNALTLGVKPIGSSVHSLEDLNTNYPSEQAHLGEAIKDVQQIGLVNDPNLEKILLLKPDLVMAWEPAKAIYPMLAQIAPTVIVPFDMPSWKEPKWKDQFMFVAEVLGKKVTAQKVMNQYHQRVEDL